MTPRPPSLFAGEGGVVYSIEASGLRIGMTVRLEGGATHTITARAVVKSELHGLGGAVTKEGDMVWVMFPDRRMLELRPNERLEVVELDVPRKES